jgi:ABC-type multidrug transport system fused ATPase/permease subunit
VNPNATAQLETAIGGITEQFQGLTRQLQSLTGTLQNLITAGLSGTTQGNKLAYAWTLLSRQVAAVFLPTIEYLIRKILQLTQWFADLGKEGQDLVQQIGLLVGVFVAFTTIASILMAVMSPIAVLVGAVAAALFYFFTQTDYGREIMAKAGSVMDTLIDGWYMLINVFELVTGALKKAGQFLVLGFAMIGQAIMGLVIQIMEWIPGLGDAAESLKKIKERDDAIIEGFKNNVLAPIELSKRGPKKKDSGGAGRNVDVAGFNFESLSASFERITSEANKKDLAMDIAKQQLDEQKKIAAGIAEIANNGWGDKQGGGGDFVGH